MVTDKKKSEMIFQTYERLVSKRRGKYSGFVNISCFTIFASGSANISCVTIFALTHPSAFSFAPSSLWKKSGLTLVRGVCCRKVWIESFKTLPDETKKTQTLLATLAKRDNHAIKLILISVYTNIRLANVQAFLVLILKCNRA